MIQILLQVLDFALKAGAAYLKTAEGKKEWQDIEDAVKEARA